ncbi:MAG: NAD(+)/NADH kinase [Candidatus Omnitrophica bacterium]|jgi:NAD+ kinase|nr:NAD(+)/NADH kinase [Candidatus Omnitrophota bacterium]
MKPIRRKYPTVRNVLVVAKKSVYEIYFVKRLADGAPHPSRPSTKLLNAFRISHDAHYQALQAIRQALDSLKVRYCMIDRNRDIPADLYDLVVTVGGDGTFLSASSQVHKELLLGVNSNPKVSVGRFCTATRSDFSRILKTVLNGKAPLREMSRMDLWLNGQFTGVRALNDLLICHISPPAMSHYSLKIQGRTEDQHSSGVWVATASGSTGAIQSAGGRPLPLRSKALQYRPRELYVKHGRAYHLKGGVLPEGAPLMFHSKMEDGMVFVDGTRAKLPFCHGDVLEVRPSKFPLLAIDHDRRLEARHLRR